MSQVGRGGRPVRWSDRCTSIVSELGLRAAHEGADRHQAPAARRDVHFQGLGISNESEKLSVRSSNANLSGTCHAGALDQLRAMGVRADANGYPMKGGTEEVSRFGYSDLTTDLCGGFGAVPGAQIHDPGEYTALKAG